MGEGKMPRWWQRSLLQMSELLGSCCLRSRQRVERWKEDGIQKVCVWETGERMQEGASLQDHGEEQILAP